MVSKANEDLPEPLRPVITVRLLRGICTSMFLRLWTRAPHTYIVLLSICLCYSVERAYAVASWRAKERGLSIAL